MLIRFVPRELSDRVRELTSGSSHEWEENWGFPMSGVVADISKKDEFQSRTLQ
jgi:hypothetical protein